MQLTVYRKDVRFSPDSSRVITRLLYTTDKRAIHTIRAVLNLSAHETSVALSQVLRDYSMRHRNISKIFEKKFNKIEELKKEFNEKEEELKSNKTKLEITERKLKKRKEKLERIRIQLGKL